MRSSPWNDREHAVRYSDRLFPKGEFRRTKKLFLPMWTYVWGRLGMTLGGGVWTRVIKSYKYKPTRYLASVSAREERPFAPACQLYPNSAQ
ncbi:hypothetical protein BU24DRAFT_426531 [Aaosphaeria arxii CBS 175.79]|uniref:Uncharacterized protein n=1 Tax=Aaosphaeria arxii CBS 175.79 TaxID=1450172 RepID=A0A6A5XEF6_9PLEO|nr:uncharacterized protein BU24DRAFT_426531 [Aaosphaeria arxii CBS 175.79]KAF2011448.1 hypothetical protein BU24DRAFT_426531 [Aaosphaeria arxii CBS 175.79]